MRKTELAFLLLAIVFMAVVFFDQWASISASDWDFNFPLLAISILLLIAVFIFDALGWHFILLTTGCRLPVRVSIRIWMISSIARYIPGGIWAYTGRAAMAKKHGVQLAAVSMSLYLETILLITSAVAVGFPALIMFSGYDISFFQALIIWLLLSLLLHPRALSLLKRLPSQAGAAMRDIKFPTFRSIAGLYLYYIVLWIVFCGTFVCFIESMYPIDSNHWLYAGSVLAISFAVGFIVVIAPGGIGVRESAIYLLLQGILPAPACLVIAITSRLWVMTGELISLGVAISGAKRRNAAIRVNVP